ADLVVPALVERLGCGMRMDVDQSWHHHEAAAADLAFGRPHIGAADLQEPVAVEGDVAARIDMAAGGAVERGDPVGIADDGGHGGLRWGAGWQTGVSPPCPSRTGWSRPR